METPPPTATAAGGTHPTGMHSCLYNFPVDNADPDKNLVKGEFVGKFTTPMGLTVSKF